MIDVGYAGPHKGCLQVQLTKGLIVLSCDLPPSRLPVVQSSQLDAQQRCLHLVQAAVEAQHVVIIPGLTPLLAQHRNALGQFGIVGGDQPRVAESTQVLGRVEAETGQVAEGTDASPVVLSADGLSAVLDHV